MQVVGGECGEMVEWNLWQGKMGEIPRKTYPDSAHQETHCTITRFEFHARWIDGVKCGLFFNHAPLGQTTLRVGRVSV